jgi:GTP cyclohydrolase IA
MEVIHPTAQNLESKIIRLTWEDVYTLINKLIPRNSPVWGVPRGGAIVAGLTGIATESINDSKIIVDDIIDSGRTLQRYEMEYPNKKFIALVDKRIDGQFHGKWVIFPWEHQDETKDIEDTVVRQLEFIGEDPLREGLKETPKRVIKAFKEMTAGYQENPRQILSKVFTEAYDEMIVLKGIEFWSLCEHHMLPFHGTATIGYIPAGKIVGISKLARLVHCFSRRLQVQERLTQEIANAMMDALKPLGVGVVLKAGHLCMACRGVRTPAEMVTSCLLGVFRDKARNEFLRFLNGTQ